MLTCSVTTALSLYLIPGKLKKENGWEEEGAVSISEKQGFPAKLELANLERTMSHACQ